MQTTIPVSPDLLFRRGDPNDPRLGEVVGTSAADYEAARIVILGCPQDEGVRRNRGREGSRNAPAAIRRQFYKLALLGLEEGPPLKLCDLGDTPADVSLEEIHDRHREIVRAVVRDDKTLIVLGGGNDVSYPDASGLAMECPSPLAFNIDAHFDVRADTPRNSGTPYRQLLDEGHLDPELFFEIGYQRFANATAYAAYLDGLGVRGIAQDELEYLGIGEVFGEILSLPAEAIFWGIDMDVVTAADAPGVSAPNPAGLRAADLLEIAEIAGGDPRSRIFEITEVNPIYDIDDRTSRLAAVAMWTFVAACQSIDA
ncbi:MAG: formimidoylglutamase [Rhodothermales bacterium]